MNHKKELLRGLWVLIEVLFFQDSVCSQGSTAPTSLQASCLEIRFVFGVVFHVRVRMWVCGWMLVCRRTGCIRRAMLQI